MGTENNNYNGPERRAADRREQADRRGTTRFSDEFTMLQWIPAKSTPV